MNIPFGPTTYDLEFCAKLSGCTVDMVRQYCKRQHPGRATGWEFFVYLLLLGKRDAAEQFAKMCGTPADGWLERYDNGLEFI